MNSCPVPVNQARSGSASEACCASETGSTSETGCASERRLSLNASLPSENVSHPRLALRLRSLSSTFAVCSCVLCAFLNDLFERFLSAFVYWTYDFAL